MYRVCTKFTLGGRISVKEFSGPVLLDEHALYFTLHYANAGGIAHGLVGSFVSDSLVRGIVTYKVSDWISDKIKEGVEGSFQTTLDDLPRDVRSSIYLEYMDPRTKVVVAPKLATARVRSSRIAGWQVEMGEGSKFTLAVSFLAVKKTRRAFEEFGWPVE